MFVPLKFFSIQAKGLIPMSAANPVNPAKRFVRCTNTQYVPESVCVLCLHTMVAPTTGALEALEKQHKCPARQEPQNISRHPRRVVGI
jgi:hypothetical protein